jgi:hypothetical protein
MLLSMPDIGFVFADVIIVLLFIITKIAYFLIYWPSNVVMVTYCLNAGRYINNM